MGIVRDLSVLPIGTEIEYIKDGKSHMLHTTSSYENYEYGIVDENGADFTLTIYELTHGNFNIHFLEEGKPLIKEEVPKNYY